MATEGGEGMEKVDRYHELIGKRLITGLTAEEEQQLAELKNCPELSEPFYRGMIEKLSKLKEI